MVTSISVSYTDARISPHKCEPCGIVPYACHLHRKQACRTGLFFHDIGTMQVCTLTSFHDCSGNPHGMQPSASRMESHIVSAVVGLTGINGTPEHLLQEQDSSHHDISLKSRAWGLPDDRILQLEN